MSILWGCLWFRNDWEASCAESQMFYKKTKDRGHLSNNVSNLRIIELTGI